MANLKESVEWIDGIYQLETTDPCMGGPEGIDNVQAKQLAARTRYLKARADEVDEAKGNHLSLAGRLDQYDQFAPDLQNAKDVAIMEALYLAGQSHRELVRLQTVKTQSGEVLITNRGVVKGCLVSKSSTATRNLSIAAGLCFYGARLFPCAAAENVAVIPSNLTGVNGSCYCYLIERSGTMRMACTEVGGEVPAEGLPLYKVNLPAGNTAENDPQGANVSLTDIRRMEAYYPRYFVSASYALIALAYPHQDTDYSVNLDVIDYLGGGFQSGSIYVGDRASNGFKIYTTGTIDEIRVRWTVTRRDD